MAQDYDKVFKENMEEIILPLAEKVLNINPEKPKCAEFPNSALKRREILISTNSTKSITFASSILLFLG
jgi:hypothetical protein